MFNFKFEIQLYAFNVKLNQLKVNITSFRGKARV